MELLFPFVLFLGILNSSALPKRRGEIAKKNSIQFTNIGDISAKDLLRIADESTNADKRFESPGQDQMKEAESEQNQYYTQTTDDATLVSTPSEQQDKFVQLLKQRYKGTFPEYNRETGGEFGKNLELEENLDEQPESAMMGQSDMYQGGKGTGSNLEDIDGPVMDNTETFDSDSELLNKIENQEYDLKKPAKIREHGKKAQNEDVGEFSFSDFNGDPYKSDNESNEVTEGPEGVDDNYDGYVDTSNETDDTDQKEDSEDMSDNAEQYKNNEEQEGTQQENQTKVGHEAEQSDIKVKQQKHAPKKINTRIHKEKTSYAKNTTNADEKEPLHSTGILKEFDELKQDKYHTKKHNSNHNSDSSMSSEEEQSQKTTGDAILDFLDKLLEKDPKKLRNDVLSMATEMQQEETKYGDKQETDDEQKQNEKGAEEQRKKPEKVTGLILKHKNENTINKTSSGKVEQVDDNSDYPEEEFDNEQYNEFHDIYPDHNAGASNTEVTLKIGTEDDDKNTVKEKNDNDLFDYEEFKEEALKMHNEFRKYHSAVALTWSNDLAKKAHNIAIQLIQATRTNFKRELKKHGQSIAILPYTTKNLAKTAIEKWYEEIIKFSFASPQIKPETRDFTQIIWKGTKELGMGFEHSPGKKKTVVVALYTPAGNKENEMSDNLNNAINDPYADIRKNIIKKHG